MTLIRRLILALALSAGLAPAFAQVPAPVPALPDTERRTSYSITNSTCACNVNFALYGDSTDFQNWVEVFLNGVRINFNDATFGWAITSPSGSLATLARPVTDAKLTFVNVVTGTVQIVGARRPRRTAQFAENTGVSARNLNQTFTDVIAMMRESWDKTNDVTGRALISQPGVQTGLLPLPSVCINSFLGFDGTGSTPVCRSSSGTGNVTLPVVAGNIPSFSGTTGLLQDSGFSYPGTAVTLNVDHVFGTDSAGCGFGTLLSACHTNYFAYQRFQSSVKVPAGVNPVIQSDCGFTETPPGAFLGTSASGSTVVVIQGDPATPANCVWNSDGITINDGAVVSIRGFTARTVTGGHNWLTVGKSGTAVIGAPGMVWGKAPTGANIFVKEGGNLQRDGGIWQVGEAACAPGCFQTHISSDNGTIDLTLASPISLPSALSFTSFFLGSGGAILISPSSYTGAGAGAGSTGGSYIAQLLARGNDFGVTIPGSLGGLTATGACWDGVCAPILTAQLPTTFPAFTLGGTVSGGGNNINNVNIGVVSPGTGAFTSLSATGVITDGSGFLMTNIAAPATPAAGTTRAYVDSTTKVLTSKNDAGTLSNTVVPSTCSAGQFGTAISAAGVFSCGAPTVAVGGITGLGTGVATALAVNVGTAGAPVVLNGALGTPSSGVGTNLTGTASGLTAGTVTTNANLTGDVTSSGNATTLTNAPVIAKVLTGYSAGSGTVAATDSVLQAFQKLGGLIDNTAWTAFTPSLSCGTATFTVNSARSKTRGKSTEIEIDYTITAIGTCTHPVNFTLPNTANSSGALNGMEIVTTGDSIICQITGASATAGCFLRGFSNFAINYHVFVAGVYENQ